MSRSPTHTPSTVAPALPRRRVPLRGGVVAIVLATAIAGGSCGLRTNPQPLSSRIPPPQDVRIWTRDSQIIVGWRNLSDRLVERWEGLERYRITLVRMPLGCIECRELERRELSLPPDDKSVTKGKDLTIYQFTPKGAPSTWSAQVRVDYSAGSSPDSQPATVDAVGNIPAESLRWEPATPEMLGSDGKPGIRLFWNVRRERVVRIVTPGGGQSSRDLMYRVNIYQRLPTKPWPPLPTNPIPIEGQFWIGPQPVVLAEPDARVMEYAMRLVDQFGNEGPASEPITIPIAKGPGI